LPTGDERIIELIRKIREETSRRDLIEQQGINELVRAEYERCIEREKAELQDEFVSRQHERDLEMQRIQLEAQTLREVMEMVAQIAGSGVNPAGAIEEIRKLLNLEAAHAATPPRELTQSPPILSKGEDVCFTHFYPSAVEPDLEAPLYVYIHDPSATDSVRRDFDVRRSFDVPSLTITERAAAQFERGTTFTIVPNINGARIKPSRIDVKWEDAFERATFSIVVNSNTPKGSGLTGEVRIYVGTLVVARLPIMFVFSDRSPEKPNEINTQTHRKYRKIFVSYSRKDEAVVRAIERLYAKYPEIETYIDYKFLRASDYWWPKIQEKIEEAEAFQLFWSVNAAESSNVSDEWKYALKLQRPIIPIILEPKPDIPSELAHIHFEDFAHFVGEL
jgi:hypothetical protein